MWEERRLKTACLAYHKIFFAFIIASPFAANENPVIQQFSVWYFLLTRQIQRGRGGWGLCVIGSGIETKELYIIVFPYAFLVCKPAEANANLPQQTKQRMANYFFFAMTKAQYLMNSGLKTGNDQHVREGNLAVQRQSVWTLFLLLLALKKKRKNTSFLRKKKKKRQSPTPPFPASQRPKWTTT